jgi:hypothetical protein
MTVRVGDWIRWRDTPDYSSFNQWYESIGEVVGIKTLKHGPIYLVGRQSWRVSPTQILEVRHNAEDMTWVTQECRKVGEESVTALADSYCELLNERTDLREQIAQVTQERDEARRSKNSCVIDLCRKLDAKDAELARTVEELK